MNFNNLTSEIRNLMLQEVKADIAAGRLYLSHRLVSGGDMAYQNALQAAILSGDEKSLARSINEGGLLVASEVRSTPSGGTTTAKVPSNAAEMLAEGEFNRFYIRAVCLQAISKGLKISVYRAKETSNPRPESQAKIGTNPDPAALLADLRNKSGVDTALGLPGGPNSGLSIQMI